MVNELRMETNAKFSAFENSLFQDIRRRLAKVPIVSIAECNTPLQFLPRLSARLGGPDIFIKRDDLTDLSLGGNKARIMEYVMADALSQGADVTIGTAFTQSNLCRQTAAAARKVGIEALLVLKGAPGDYPRGNLVLNVMLGANLHFINSKDDQLIKSYIQMIMEDMRNSGKRPYFFDSHTDMSYLATYAYLDCFLEIFQQSHQLGIDPAAIFIATASGGTQSGLDMGIALFKSSTRLIAVNPMSWSADWIHERVIANIKRATANLGFTFDIDVEAITVLPEYAGAAYGIPTELSREAQRLFALDEAILLDTYYTSKAAGAMIDWIRKGQFSKGQSVIFVHTGGVPSLFADSLNYDLERTTVLTEDEANVRIRSRRF